MLRLYVNGTQVSTKNVTGAMANSAGPLQIGGNNVWAEWFQGQIDDLRVYNRALTPSQLQTDMNTPVAPPPAGDTQAPSAPAGLVVSGQTQTALTLSWNASTDNVGVTGYGTYRNSAAAGTTAPATRTYTYTGLACGTAYSLGVDAVDAAGNRSTQTTASGTTSACTPGDTQAPSAPAGLVVSGQTQTALTLSWNASTDNVGVTGYSTYRNSAAAGTTAAGDPHLHLHRPHLRNRVLPRSRRSRRRRKPLHAGHRQRHDELLLAAAAGRECGESVGGSERRELCPQRLCGRLRGRDGVWQPERGLPSGSERGHGAGPGWQLLGPEHRSEGRSRRARNHDYECDRRDRRVRVLDSQGQFRTRRRLPRPRPQR